MIDNYLQKPRHIGIICKTITFPKIESHTKYKKSNVSSHLHIFWLNFDKANHSLIHPFLLWGKHIFERMLPGRMSNFFWLGCETLGASFKWGGAWVKMAWINASLRNVNSINSKHFPYRVGYKSLRENATSILERDKALGSL